MQRAQKLHTDDVIIAVVIIATQIWLVLLIGRVTWEMYFNQSETLARSW